MGHVRRVNCLLCIVIAVIPVLTGQAAIASGGTFAISTQPSEPCKEAVSALQTAKTKADEAKTAAGQAMTAAGEAKKAEARAKTTAAKAKRTPRAKDVAAKAKKARAKAKDATARAKKARAKAKKATDDAITAYREAANRLRVLPRTSADFLQACDPAVRDADLSSALLDSIRTTGVNLLLSRAVQQPPVESQDGVIGLMDDALVLAGGGISPCPRAKALREAKSFDQAEALLTRLAALGDDDTVKCAKRELAALAADRMRASDPRGVVERLSAQSSGSVVPVLLAATVGLLVALLLGRLARSAFPSARKTSRMRRWWDRCAGAGLTAAAVSLGALVGAYLSSSWSPNSWSTKPFPDLWPPSLSSPGWWVAASLSVIAVIAVIAVIEFASRLVSTPRTVSPILAWVGLVVAALGGFMAASFWAAARQWLGVGCAIAAVVLLTAWAGSRLRVSFGEFTGGETTPKGFSGAVAAELLLLGQEAPRGVDVVAGTDQTQLPADQVGQLPGGKWASALLAVWRAITPSRDLVVTGAFIERGGGEQGVAVSLRRGRRVESGVTIESRMFGSASANSGVLEAPNPQPSDEERMAAWHDLATAVAAWLLHRLGALTAEELPGLAGAKRWESTALNAVAAHRLDQHQNAAALPLLLDAISLDPGNLAAQYGRLALEARQINGAAPDAGRRYWNTYEALVALSLKGPAPKTLQWRCTYNIGVLLINGARAPRSVGLPMGSERAAEEAAKQLGELITKLRCETDEKTGPLAKELIDLSRTACLGAALLARAYGDVVRTAVREATACTRKSPSDNKACDQGSRADLATPEQVCQHIDRWLDPKELDLLASRVSYNAACTRALLDEDKIKQGQVPPKLEAFLRRAFQERQLAKNAGYDPFLKELRELSWFRSLQEEAGAKPKPIGLAAFAAVSGHIKRLADADICTLEELRARLGRDDERQRLASMLGLPQQQLLTWRAMLELWALPGKDEPPIPIETINLLAAVGISSIAELSTQRSRVLRERLNAARYALGADAALPEEAELKTWIDHAKLRGSPIRSSAS